MPFDNPLPKTETPPQLAEAANLIELGMARIATPDQWCKDTIMQIENGKVQRCVLGSFLCDGVGHRCMSGCALLINMAMDRIRQWIALVEAGDYIMGKPVPGDNLRAQIRSLGSRYLYHGTPASNLPAIEQQGVTLQSRSRRSWLGPYPDRIYFSITPDALVEKLQLDDAQHGRLQHYVILTIDSSRLSADVRLFFDPESSKDSVYTETGSVPANAIVAQESIQPNQQNQYYHAAVNALRKLGFTKLVGGDDFAVSDNAILIYVEQPISNDQLKRVNRIISSHGFPEIVFQAEYGDGLDGAAELVGYLAD